MSYRNITSIVQDMHAGGMKTDLLTTALVISYEVGIMNQQIFYSAVRGADLREGHVAHAATEMADAVMQMRVLAELLGLDFSIIMTMGEDKLYERLGEFADKTRPRPDVELANGGAKALSKPRSAYSYTSGDGPRGYHKHDGD